MIFFNFTKKDADNAQMQQVNTTDVNEVPALPESGKASERPLVVSYATGWPIDVIYGYLHKNFEEKGFNDAMINSDGTFCDLNLELIKKKILMIFREINLNYDVKKCELETQIGKCQASGLVTTVASIQDRVSLIESHKMELKALEDEFVANPLGSFPLKSYRCGFLRGISSIAIGASAGTTPVRP